ncbi:MFS general substrate transporter [Hesseltinella vesiculosa]|uniref:MFS general substrate transporter n=1 Tax=Hesseltinella vesiculosa TaxID=101127 RepID=A0A1X2GWF1_9FUNG|nr:MFS general substrate transporter [Hesseltinella vesiculosa]
MAMTGILEKISVDQADTQSTTSPKKHVYSPAEKRLKLKIDRLFLPMLFCIVFIQFMDKSILNFAAAMNIMEDTHITSDDFAWLGSIFYIGFLVFQIPNNFLIQWLPIGKYLGGVTIAWGVTFACTALCKDFTGLIITRLLLGMAESVTYPCIFILISTFYRRQEQVVCVAAMFLANAVAIMVGGLIGFGIAHLQGLHGLSAWQYCYIIFGSITFTVGIVFFFTLPDTPKSKWFFLTAEEELLVDDRLKDNGQAVNTTFNKAHVREALAEPRYYAVIAIVFLGSLQNGAFTTFSTQIIQALGFTNFQSILMNIPMGVCSAILICIMTYLSKHFNQICYIAMLSITISFTSMLLLIVLPNTPVKLVGILLSYSGTPTYLLTQTLIINNVKGYSKKVFYTSSQLVSYSLGNFVGPLMMLGGQKPRYFGAMAGYTIANVIQFLLFAFVRWSLTRSLFKRKDVVLHGSDREISDLTDKEDLTFAYRP